MLRQDVHAVAGIDVDCEHARAVVAIARAEIDAPEPVRQRQRGRQLGVAHPPGMSRFHRDQQSFAMPDRR